MLREVNPDAIKKKLSGIYAPYYPIYTKLRDECLKIGEDVRIILKTVYILIDSNSGLLAVVFWTKEGLEIGLPIEMEHRRLECANHLRYNGIHKMIRLSRVEDVDDFFINIIKGMYIKFTATALSK